MNILDKHYPEISFKTDAEDLKVMIDFINTSASIIHDNYTIQAKVSSALLKEVRYKLVVKEEQKRGSSKKFLMKFKPYQIYALINVFANNEYINQNKPFERNSITKYSHLFHQKLTGL